MKKRKKVFLGTQEISGILLKIHKELDRRGIENTFLCFWEYAFAGKNDHEYKNKELDNYFKCVKRSKKCKEKNAVVGRKIALFLEMLSVLGIYIKALFHYDIFFFVYGQGIFRNTMYLKNLQDVEFFLYKLLKKKVIVLFVGSDSRPPYCDVYTDDLDKLRSEIEWNYKKVRRMEKYADVIIDNPANSFFHRKPFVQYTYFGNVVSDDDLAANMLDKHERDESEPVVIVHAPSDTVAKGTECIRQLMSELKKEGYSIEYDEITGVSHEEVIKHIGNADIVINQMYSDIPMSMLDTEAAINGVAVVTCGYFAEYYRDYMPSPLPPTIYCHPSEIKENVIRLINDKNYRREVGKREKEFVTENWRDRVVVDKLLKMINGEIPDEVFFDPYKSEYLWGAVCSKENVVKMVSALIEKYGEGVLKLDDKPLLKDRYLKTILEER